MSNQTESITEVLSLILSTIRQAEAEGVTLAEARARVEQAARERWGLEPGYLESLEGGEVLSFPQWLDAMVDMLPVGTIIGWGVEALRKCYAEGMTPSEAAERIRSRSK